MNTVSIDTIRQRYAPGEGRHWFDPGTLRFFRSRLPSQGYEGADGRVYFVTSERNSGAFGGPQYPRLYSVRVLKGPGDIDTVGEFQGFRTRGAADGYAQRLAKLGTKYEPHGRLCNSRPEFGGHKCTCWKGAAS